MQSVEGTSQVPYIAAQRAAAQRFNDMAMPEVVYEEDGEMSDGTDSSE
jgi:hypothetical protein